MAEGLLVGIIGRSVAGGLSILAFCCLSWIFRRKYGAKSRKHGWLLIAVCLKLPYTHVVQLPKLVIKEAAESKQNTKSSMSQPEQKGMQKEDMHKEDIVGTAENEVHGTARHVHPERAYKKASQNVLISMLEKLLSQMETEKKR